MKKITALITLIIFMALQACGGRDGQRRSAEAGGQRPVIGISAGISDKGVNTLNDTYVQAILDAGGTAVIVPVVRDSTEAAVILSGLDGILFSGGEDFDPALYGESIRPDANVSINARRDSSDLRYARMALKAGMPVMGICRGMQMLNIVCGGTLYQDLPTQHPGPIAHRQSEPGDVPTHSVIVERGSLLHSLTGADTLYVNTFHHQAVKDLAPSLRLAATAPDGVIEAYENDQILGVQFHPEKLHASDSVTWLPVFREFIRRCKQ